MTFPSIEIPHICNVHVESTETIAVVRKDSESLTQSISRNFFDGIVAGAVGRIIPLSRSIRTEMPTTRAYAARLNGSLSHDTIVLTGHKMKTTLGSCWGGGFGHPIDLHLHTPSREECSGEKPGDPFARMV